MTSNEFRRALKAEPFIPFVVRLASGRTLSVPHPDFAACPPDTRIAVVYDTKEAAFDHVDLLLVESIEFRRNGHRRGKGKAA